MNLIIQDIEEVKETVSDLGNGISYLALKSDIKRAQDKHLKPALGNTLLTKLVAEFADNEESASASSSSSTAYTPYTETQFNELKELAQAAVALIAISYYIPRGYAQLSSSMISQKTSESSTTLSYFERQELAQQYLEMGLEAMDEMLTYLEENKMSFEDWVAGDGYTVYHDYFIKTADEFNKEVNINSSSRTFKLLGSSMKYVEDINLPAGLSQAIVDEIRSENKKSSPGAKFAQALVYVKSYVAHASIVRFMESHKVKIDRNAIIQIETAGDHIDKKYQADRLDINTVKEFHNKEADAWMTKLRSYLNTNASSFSNWTADDTSTWEQSDLANSTGKTIGL